MSGFGRFCVPRRTLHKTVPTCGNSGAAELSAEIYFSAVLPESARNTKLLIFDDGTGYIKEYFLTDGRAKVLSSELCPGDWGGLFFYKFVFETDSGAFQIVLAPDGISDIIRDKSEGFEDAFQLTVYKKRDVYPSWLYGGIMYHIFVDRFFRGGDEPCRSDAVMNGDWYGGIPPYARKNGEKFDNNVFFGGDLAGIEKKLDYLESLGVSCLYLSPVFEAYSNHKYDTGNYDKIDDMFGGEDAFLSLLNAANARKIGVILDGVFNHTGDDSVYFNRKGRYGDGGAYRDPDSPYREWYNFYSYPDKYECWWGVDVLPRVKSDTDSYKKYIFGENGVLRRRLREGVSGWRLDVADELSDGFLRELKTAATEEKPDCCIIGEVWENASRKVSYGVRRKYFQGGELDSVMNYPVRDAIIAYLRDGNSMFFLKTVSDVYGTYPPETSACLMNVIGTHDTVRLITALAGELPDGKTPEERAAYSMTGDQFRRGVFLSEAAYFISSLLPGVPCIYYGDEAGMEGYSDPFNRRPYPWGRENKDLLDFYRKLGNVRRTEKTLFCGDFRIVYIDSDILCIERTAKGELLCAVVNLSGEKYVFSSDEKSHELLYGQIAETIEIPSRSCALIKSADGGKNYGVYKKL